MPHRTSRPSSTYDSTSAASPCSSAARTAGPYSEKLCTSDTPTELSDATGFTTTGRLTSRNASSTTTRPAGTGTPAAATADRADDLSIAVAITVGGFPM